MNVKILFEKSFELMYEFFSRLNEKEKRHIGLMGGWAVYLVLKSKGINHLGSRDIDIFFNSNKVNFNIIKEKLNVLGFQPHSSFRWVKIFHSETGKELSMKESKNYPLYDLSYVYFDIAAPEKLVHLMPEPLLKKVFIKEKNFINVNGLEIMVPTSKILIEMKFKSSISRTDSFKRSKDLADLYDLLDNAQELWEIKNGVRIKTKNLNKTLIKNFKKKIQVFKIDGSIASASLMLGTEQNKIINLFQKI